MDLSLIIIGFIAVVFGAALTFSQAFTRNYVKLDPRISIWHKILGNDEEFFTAMRRLFGPLSMLIGIVMIVLAIVLFVKA